MARVHAPDPRSRRTNRSRFALVVAAGVALTVVAAAACTAAYLLRPRIARPVSGCPTPGADTFDDLLKCGTKLYSQYNEELIIRHFFRDRRDGIFVDVGASHYKSDSTTYYLEHHLNWSGVAVDALAEYGPDYERFRPKTRFSAYIVTDHSGGVEAFYKPHVKFLMSTVSKEWMEGSGDKEYDVLQLPTTTLNDLLAKYGLSKIDFLSMDIEAGEPAALAGFDIERYRPELVCIEVSDLTRNRIVAYFAAHNFERIARYAPFDQLNWYFEPRSK